MQLTGAQIVIECLKEQGVDTIFGYPGGAILNVYDELYKHRNEIRHVLTSHEQGASHAADGYARSTGKVGVCFATSGPGATNLVTGIATAYMDSVPMVAITCNVTVPLLGKDSFQEIDIAGITTPITKHNFIVTDVKELADVIRRAFRIAQTGRPGPVLVDIPKDITAQKTEYKAKEIQPVERLTQKMTEEDIEQAVSYIRHAKKPYIFVGGGAVISEASEELKEFVELVDAPVTDTLMGKGAYDGTGERYTGMLGMHGTKTSNLGVSECDLLIAIGVRFSDRVIGNAKKFARHAKILQFDVDPAEVNKNIVVDACVMGDVREILKKVNERLEPMEHREWMEHILEYKKQYPLTYHPQGLSGPYMIEKIYELTNGDATIVTEVGQHQMWAAQFYKYSRPRQLITSGGLGTMGYGVGACIGCKLRSSRNGGCRLHVIEFLCHVHQPDGSHRKGIPGIRGNQVQADFCHRTGQRDGKGCIVRLRVKIGFITTHRQVLSRTLTRRSLCCKFLEIGQCTAVCHLPDNITHVCQHIHRTRAYSRSQ